MPRVFVSPNGFPILVGKNKRENDIISLQHAQPHDFWLHAIGHAGAHVLLQWNGDSCHVPSEDDVKYAAQVAGYYSKGRGLPTVLVRLARGCDVYKENYSRTGTVACTSPSMILIKPKEPKA